MARLWQTGFELNSLAIGGMEYAVVSSGSGMTVQTSVVRSGTYALRINTTSVRRLRHQFLGSSADARVFARMYFRADTFHTGGLVRICEFQNTISNVRASIRLNPDGTLELWNATAQIGSDSPALSTGQWYRIDIEYNSTPAGSNDVLTARIDGTSFASSSVEDLGNVARFDFGLIDAPTGTPDFFYDDIAINDSTGSFENSFPSPGRIVHLRPNNTGDNGAWSGDYTDIDEETPDDNTTKISSNTAEQIEDVNLADTPAAIETDSIINLVATGVRYNGAGASANASFVTRVKTGVGGAVEESSAITPSSTSWTTNANNDPYNFPLVLYDLPGASTAEWTKAKLDAAQIGARLTSASTNAAQISALWLSVEYREETGANLKTDQIDISFAAPPTQVNIQKSLQYAVKAKASVTKSLQYAVKAPAALTKSLKYVIPIAGLLQKTLVYAVAKAIPITKSLQYAVKPSVAVTKSLQYTVVAPAAAVTKSLQYAVKTPQGVTKSLQYAVTIVPSALTKELKYSIERLIFYDNFTEGTNTNLEDHTPNIGTNWVRLATYNDPNARLRVNADNDYLENDGSAFTSDGVLYSAESTYSKDYLAEVEIVNNIESSDDPYILAVRIQDSNNMYALRFNNDNFQLYKCVGGTWTPLGSNQNLNIQLGDKVKVSIVENTLKAYVNGVAQDTQTVTDHPNAGRAGYGIGAVILSGDDSHNQIIDNFKVINLGADVLKVTKSLQYAVAAPLEITKALKYTVFVTAAAITSALKYSIERVIFRDQFDEESNTTLVSHTPNVGDSWTRLLTVNEANAALQVNAANDNLENDGVAGLSDGVLYTADATYPKDYFIEAQIAGTVESSDDPYILAVRIQDSDNMYALRFNNDVFQLYTKVGGTWTPLGSNSNLNIQSGDVIKLSIVGTSLKAYVNNTLQKSETVTDLSNAGKAGYGIGSVILSGNDSDNQVIDNLKVVNLGEDISKITKSLQYIILRAFSITKGLQYAVVAKASITKDLTYTVVKAASITKGLTYAVKVPAAITKNLTYAVKAPQAVTKSLQYNILVSNAITKSLQYAVKQPEAISKNLTYTVVAPQAITKNLTYAVSVPTPITKSLQYAIKRAYPITKSLRYEIDLAAPIVIQKSLQYTVKISVAETKDLKYTVVAPAAALTKFLIYRVTTSASITKSLEYRVAAPQSITKSLQYTVTAPQAITKNLTYITVGLGQNIQKSLTYAVTAPSSIQKSLKYTVVTSDSVTKSLEYQVTTPAAITKNLEYQVVTPAAITKSLQYTVTVQAEVQKTLTYAVEISQAITKSLTYVINLARFAPEPDISRDIPAPAVADDLPELYTDKQRTVVYNDPPVDMEGSELMEGSWFMEDQTTGLDEIEFAPTKEEDIELGLQPDVPSLEVLKPK